MSIEAKKTSHINTVGQLRDFLAAFPDDLEVMSFDGEDLNIRHLVSKGGQAIEITEAPMTNRNRNN